MTQKRVLVFTLSSKPSATNQVNASSYQKKACKGSEIDDSIFEIYKGTSSRNVKKGKIQFRLFNLKYLSFFPVLQLGS